MIKEKILHVRETVCTCHQVYGMQYSVVGLFDNEKMTISYGIAKTHKDDNFSKKIGRELATYRATNAPILVEEVRRLFSTAGLDQERLFRIRVEQFAYGFIPESNFLFTPGQDSVPLSEAEVKIVDARRIAREAKQELNRQKRLDKS